MIQLENQETGSFTGSQGDSESQDKPRTDAALTIVEVRPRKEGPHTQSSFPGGASNRLPSVESGISEVPARMGGCNKSGQPKVGRMNHTISPNHDNQRDEPTTIDETDHYTNYYTTPLATNGTNVPLWYHGTILSRRGYSSRVVGVEEDGNGGGGT